MIATTRFYRITEAGRGPPENQKNRMQILQNILAIIGKNTYIGKIMFFHPCMATFAFLIHRKLCPGRLCGGHRPRNRSLCLLFSLAPALFLRGLGRISIPAEKEKTE